LRTVFVFISGITTFTGFAGGAGFFASGFGGATVGGGVAIGILPVTAAEIIGLAVVGDCWGFTPAAGVFEARFAGAWVFTGDLAILDTAVFFTGVGTDFLAGAAWATFLATGLAILLAAGAFLTDLLEPDEWAGFEAVFLAGAIFLTFAAFLAGLAAFFLVAIQLGFFCNEHF
jgi:hypothetical protein